MADNTRIPAGTADGSNVADDELDTLNGVGQSAPKPKAQRIKVVHGEDGDGTDTSAADPLPVDDAATQTALASLLTELGQKLEPADLAALATAAKQDLAKTVLDNILLAVDGLEGKDYATQATLAAVLTELGQKLEPGGEVALAAATLTALETIELGATTLAALETIGLDSATLTALETITIGTALPPGTNAIGKLAANSGVDIGDVDVTSVPADPFGANADASVAAGATGSIQAKLRRATQGLEDLKSLIVLAAGSNVIGKVDHPTTGIDEGRKVVTTAGTRVALAASTPAKWVTITAETDNTGYVVVGSAAGVIAALATREGTPLVAGENISLPVDNLADVGLDSTVSGDGVTFSYGK